MFNILGLVFALLLASALDCPVFAVDYDLANMQPGDTMVLGADHPGNSDGDKSYNVATATCDFNGDGNMDIVVGSWKADGPSNTRSSAGEVYVIYGRAGQPATIDIAALTPSEGIIIYGAEADDNAGYSVSAGDFNGDGISDVIVGAFQADGPGNTRGYAGEVYVIYGTPTPPATIDTAALSSSQGLIIYGASVFDNAGRSLSAGDFNGDGKSDVIIGADQQSGSAKGKVYVIYGTAAQPASIDTAALTPSKGLTINGVDNGDRAGYSVSAGDFNGDGKADVIVGAPYAWSVSNGRLFAGEAYVIYGSVSPPSTINTATLTSSQGLIIYGAGSNDNSGYSVSAGDFNGDGKSDVILGAPYADGLSNGRINAGEVYVIYGSSGQPVALDMALLSSSQGMYIYGADMNGYAGYSVSAGDFNGDGKSDVIGGAYQASPNNRSGAGGTYVIYGSSAPPAATDIAALTSSQGLIISGAEDYDNAGISVSAGDFNGDGRSDVVVGAQSLYGGPANSRWEAGEVYVVYGSASPPGAIDIASLTSSQGLIVYGAEGRSQLGGDFFGQAMASGDFNGDGKSDVIVGAYYADGQGNNRLASGETYVIYGSAFLPAAIDIASLTPSEGMIIYGAESVDFAGISVSAGDFNGDGISDAIIGANAADGPGNSRANAGETYVIYGSASPPATIDMASLTQSQGLIIYGADADDRAGESVSAGDFNGDGKSDVIVGAWKGDGPSNGRTDAGDVYVIYGSASPPATIDLASLPSSAGLIIYAADGSDYAGRYVSAGDFNGDGRSDVIFGAEMADGPANSLTNAGEAYVIYGSSIPPITIDLGSLTSTQGLILYGAVSWNRMGSLVSTCDFDGDGKSEVIVYGVGAWPPLFVVYGTASQPATVTLDTDILTPSEALFVYPKAGTGVGSLSSGDLNGDGISDLIVGSPWADGPADARTDAGETYVIYGTAAKPGSINLASLTPAQGLTAYGADAYDEAGSSVSSGDLDGDGTFSHLLIGSRAADSLLNTRADAGEIYVLNLAPTVPIVDTPPSAIINLSHNPQLTTPNSITLTWTAPGDNGSSGNNGPGAFYTLKYATFPATNKENWFNGLEGTIYTYTQAWTVGVQGSQENFAVNGLDANTTYYFSVKTTDGANNTSLVDTAVPQANVLTRAAQPGVQANPFLEVNLSSVTVSWLANGNPGYTEYFVQASTAGDIAGTLFYPVPGAVWFTSTFATVVNLSTGAIYYFEVKARNLYNLETTFQVLGSTRTLTELSEISQTNTVATTTVATTELVPPAPDNLVSTETVTEVVTPPPSPPPLISTPSVPPSVPGGLYGNIAGSPGLNVLSQGALGQDSFVLQWLPVTSNYDGARFVDPSAPTPQELVGYRVFRATSATGAWVEIGTIAQPETKWAEAFSGKNVFYYKIRAYDDEPSESRDSMIIDISLHLSTLTNERDAELKVDSSMMSNAYSKFGNFIIRANQKSEDIVGPVLKSVHFEAVDPNTEEVVRNFSFSEPEATITLHYGNSGSGVLASSQEPGSDSLCLYWHNGFEFIKVFGRQNVLDETISLKTPYLGTYQLRALPRAAGFEFASANVSNQLLTPNGDNKNDTVVFIFDNPKDSQVVSKVYDLTGAFVAEMTPGPLSNSLEWDGKANGSIVSGGVYIYQIQGEGKTYNGTIVVAR